MSEGNGKLPAGWAEVRLGMLLASTPNVVPANEPNTEFELWSVPAFDYGTPEFQRGSAIGSNKQVVEPGDVLLCKINPRINRVWKVAEASARPQIASTEWIVLRSTEVDPAFLMYRLREPGIRDVLTSNVSGVGGSLTRVRPATVREIPIELPPLPEQRRIVARIEELQARTSRAREALEGVPPLLEQLRQSVLASAFRGDLTADWRESHPDVEPAAVLLERIRAERRRQWEEAELEKMREKGKEPKDDRWKRKYQEPEPVDASALPELPGGWVWAAAEEIAAPGRPIIYGIIKPGPDTPGGVPYVRVTEMKGGQIDVSALRRCAPARAAKFSRATLRSGDVLVSKDGTIGKVAIVPPELEGGNITQHVLRVSPSKYIRPDYLARAIETPLAQQWMTGELKGIGLQGINVGDFRRIPIPLAPASEQAALCEVLDTALGTVARQRATCQIALALVERLDHSTLARAFQGELVPQDPNDEPASVLLKRIREERNQQPKRGRKR